MDRYEEALERAKAGKPMDEVFPELKESEDERIRKYLIDVVNDYCKGSEREGCIAYLERQKENASNTDSIPSNCASDAKCEDRHNKPGDFIFELRQIISRHWWADEHSDRIEDEEGMAKEILELCEKQKEQKPSTEETELNSIAFLEQMGYTCIPPKEQKPNIELIQRSWYMEGYTDGKFKREPMWNLVTGKGGPRYEKNEKYGQPLEQKPKAIRMTGSFVDGSYKFDVVDMPKPAEWSEDEMIRKMLLDMCDDWEISKPCRVDKGDVPGVRAWLKNRKPAWTEEDESFVQHILPRILDPSRWTLDQQNADREQLKKFIDNFKGRYVVLNPIFRVGDAMRTIDEAAKGIKDGLPYVVSIDSEYYICNNEKIRIENQGDYEFPPMNRKQPAEWSEEDEKTIHELSNIIVANAKDGYLGRYYAPDLVMKLQSLRPQPHWKPSEEQMEALYTAAREAPIIKENGNYLYDLYDDLKKL